MADLDFLKECFENEDSFNNFVSQVEGKGYKLADISTGDYVSNKKFYDETKKYKDLKKQYDELQESIKGDEGINKKVANLETELNDWKSKYSTLEGEHDKLSKRATIIKNGVKEEFADFVYSEVKKNINENVDFDTAFKKFKTDNPQYNTESTKKKVGINPDMNGGSGNTDNNNKFMNNLIRGIE